MIAHPEAEANVNVIPPSDPDWDWAHSRTPIGHAARLIAEKASPTMFALHAYIGGKLNLKTKNGWTVIITDERAAKDLSVSLKWVKVARCRLVKAGFMLQADATYGGQRIIGARKFFFLETVPLAKAKAHRKSSKYKERENSNIVDFPSPSTDPTPPEGETLPPDDGAFLCPDVGQGHPTIEGQLHPTIEGWNSSLENAPANDSERVCSDEAAKEQTIVETIVEKGSPPIPPPTDAAISPVARGEGEGLYDIFIEKAKPDNPFRTEARRRDAETFLLEIEASLVSDNRLIDANLKPRQVMIQSFCEVRKILAPIHSHVIMDHRSGQEAINRAITRLSRRTPDPEDGSEAAHEGKAKRRDVEKLINQSFSLNEGSTDVDETLDTLPEPEVDTMSDHDKSSSPRPRLRAPRPDVDLDAIFQGIKASTPVERVILMVNRHCRGREPRPEYVAAKWKERQDAIEAAPKSRRVEAMFSDEREGNDEGGAS